MAADYTIIGQRQSFETVGPGRILDVWEVRAAVPEAHTEVMVRVPLADSSPQAVDAALRPLVDRAKAIAGL